MQDIELTDGASQRLKELGEEFRSYRREALAKAGQELLQEVQGAIAGSLDDGRFLVRSWQWARLGTGGGYSAVQARPKETYQHPGSKGAAQALGAVTNYLESGHEKVLWGRRTGGRARAYHFYEKSEAAGAEIGRKLAREFNEWFERKKG